MPTQYKRVPLYNSHNWDVTPELAAITEEIHSLDSHRIHDLIQQLGGPLTDPQPLRSDCESIEVILRAGLDVFRRQRANARNASASRSDHSSVSLFFKKRYEYSLGQGTPRSASSTFVLMVESPVLPMALSV